MKIKAYFRIIEFFDCKTNSIQRINKLNLLNSQLFIAIHGF